MIWIMLLIAAVILIAVASSGNTNAQPGTLAHKIENTYEAGAYKGGHPLVDKQTDTSYICIKEDRITFDYIKLKSIQAGAPILFSQIKNVIVEDATTFEKRVTLGRVLLVGIFALAWKKNKKKEACYMTIEWNDGRFDHQTIFEFDGSGAISRANTIRNAIIKNITAFESKSNEAQSN